MWTFVIRRSWRRRRTPNWVDLRWSSRKRWNVSLQQGVMLQALDSESKDPRSNLVGTCRFCSQLVVPTGITLFYSKVLFSNNVTFLSWLLRILEWNFQLTIESLLTNGFPNDHLTQPKVSLMRRLSRSASPIRLTAQLLLPLVSQTAKTATIANNRRTHQIKVCPGGDRLTNCRRRRRPMSALDKAGTEWA